MCGIFGLFARPQGSLSRQNVQSTLESLYKLSESRGKESAGFHLYLPEKSRAWTLKAPRSASELMRSSEYRSVLKEAMDEAYPEDAPVATHALAVLAHSRLVTNGTAALAQNNQPVRVGGVTIIHNGIVVNVDDLWAQHPQLQRQAEVDTEVLAALVQDGLCEGAGPLQATARVFSQLRGAASVAWVHEAGNFAVLATNTGDLYYFKDKSAGCLIFASERYILATALAENGLQGAGEIRWLEAGHAVLVDLHTLDSQCVELQSTATGEERGDWLNGGTADHHDLNLSGPAQSFSLSSGQADYGLLRYDEERLKALKRCTRCVLPETFPFIRFDQQGVCNYCHGYRTRYKGVNPEEMKARFLRAMEQYRVAGGSPDVLVPFSGGRDSSYGLHLIKKEFGFTPITFTYDWGMVTDLARRNVARMCGQLGVQNILVSADIRTKRDNVRKNVSAWLKKPDLGMVPLFMAGDKHFFSIVNTLKKQTGIRLDLWSANPLENTDFKTGFCGVAPDFDKSRLDYLSMGRKARMALHYAKNFMLNPRYLNSSLLDTAAAFSAYYFEPRRDFYFMFNDLVWEEGAVNSILLSEYNWELASDTQSTWRIGDGTAPFYNYIYVTARGFSEFDTFRSNQIREGMLTREQAMQELFVENRPRAESLRWYLDAIGLEFNEVIRRVNRLDTLGLHR